MTLVNPFLNKETGEDEFPYKAIRDVIFILPVSDPTMLGMLIIPEEYRINHRDEYGMVLSAGPGAYIPRFKKWIPTTVKPGDVVVYDSGVPTEMYIPDKDGNKHFVKVMGERDLQGIVRG
jgi:co-chaperonin GroES (HSP10)